MNISLTNFLQTGKLGDIQLGMSLEQFLSILGPPDSSGDATSASDERTRGLRYGSFIFAMDSKDGKYYTLTAIDWMPSAGMPALPTSCKILDWEISIEVKPLTVKHYLRTIGIKFNRRTAKGYFVNEPASQFSLVKPNESRSIERTTTFRAFVLSSNVIISFVDDKLTGIGISG